MRVLPNFLIVGPPRTGTTWLYHCLKTHPEVYLPDIKQLHFFDANLDKGTGWYSGHFTGAEGRHRAIGEATPDYITAERGPERIREVLGGNTRILIVYREPVERAFSHYKIGVRSGRYRGQSFREACDSDPLLVENGLYGRNLERFESVFGPERIYVGSFEDMKRSGREYLKGIFGFLGVAPGHEVGNEILVRRYARSVPVSRVGGLTRAVISFRNALERTGIGRRTAEALRNLGIVSAFHKATSETEEARLGPEERDLAERRFREDLARFHRRMAERRRSA
jgi:hypothetical protein